MRIEITMRIDDSATAASIDALVAATVAEINTGGERVDLVVRIDDSDIKVRTKLTALSADVLTRAKLIDSGAGVDVVRTGTDRRVAAKLDAEPKAVTR